MGPDQAANAASERVSSEVEDFISHVDVERRRLYRAHLQAAVRRVSPLALDLAVFGGSRLVDLAWEFEPPAGWPWRPLDAARSSVSRATAAAAAERPTHGGVGRRRRAIATRRGGMVTCAPPGRSDVIGFMVIGPHVEVVAALGGVTVQTVGVQASLLIPEVLPDTVASSLPGRRLDALFRHPILDGRGYVIESVADFRQGDGSTVNFRAGLLPFEMPWGRA
jgi:hypothetical protein